MTARNSRDECWTESATKTLIDSWGERYLKLNRGNLRQADWLDVAHAVNSTRDISKPPRSGIQCKNRLDTVKKKYKVEKSKNIESKWPFFKKMDYLLAGGKLMKSKGGLSVFRLPGEGESVSDVSEKVEFGGDGGNGCSGDEELGKAFVRFAEVYERVENSKWDAFVKMEKERLEFVKEVEFGRVKMLMETQVEIEKIRGMMMMMKKRVGVSSVRDDS
ncbi:trihelix protein [Artemisia annua]|uniref:Trihelix protein n=1 Tax=Artemisia annua TaxID=35608 RepID=A0A2U1MKG3_ARTAN|nr:trihelix protein [Artemisia annua]